jgi:hypothetical protein
MGIDIKICRHAATIAAGVVKMTWCQAWRVATWQRGNVASLMGAPTRVAGICHRPAHLNLRSSGVQVHARDKAEKPSVL